MMAMAIIGTLAAIAVPNYVAYRERALMTRAISDIQHIEREIDLFLLDNDRLPSSLAEIGLDGLRDPYGNPYEYRPVAGTPKGKLRKDRFLVPVNSDYDLYSKGRDGRSASPFTAKHSRDDIVRANDGAYIGLAADF
jgi:general secretion pathway protein G